MSEKNEIKVILLGETGVGKTNLIRAATDKVFDPNTEATLASTHCERRIQVDNKSYQYFLWDTIGQEKYRALSKLYINNSKIILIVFAINHKESFEQIDFWYKSVKEQLGNDGYLVALIGNKKDLYEAEDIVEDEEIEKKANELGVKYKKTSAKTEGVLFKEFLDEILEEYIRKFHPEEYKEKNSFKINKPKNNGKNGKKCCLGKDS